MGAASMFAYHCLLETGKLMPLKNHLFIDEMHFTIDQTHINCHFTTFFPY